jgi:hypothetical protein
LKNLLRSPESGRSLDLDPEQVVAFLEEQLEIDYEA